MKHRILVVAGGLLLVGSLVSAQTSLEAEISLGDVSAELDRLAAMEDDTVVGDALRRYVKELRTVVGDASGSQSAADHGDNEVAAIVRDLERILTSRRASDIAAGVRQYVVSLGVLVAVRTSSESGGARRLIPRNVGQFVAIA